MVLRQLKTNRDLELREDPGDRSAESVCPRHELSTSICHSTTHKGKLEGDPEKSPKPFKDFLRSFGSFGDYRVSRAQETRLLKWWSHKGK